MRKHILIAAVFISALLPLPTTALQHPKPQTPMFPVNLPNDFPDAGATFNEVRKLILDKYYTTTITEQALYYAAIRGMLRHVSPPQLPELAKIWAPEGFDKFQDHLKGVDVSVGIKANLNPAEGSLTVTDVLPESSSLGKLRPHDRIMRINGKPLKGLTSKAVEKLLRGKTGTEVKLTVVRDIEIFHITIKRSLLKVKNIVTEVLPNNAGYLRISAFTASTTPEANQAIKNFKEQGINKVIIDLRNNTGGVFIESLRLAELFLPKKSIMLRTLTHPEKIDTYVSSNERPYDMDIIVLVNKQTASSSEVFSAALRGHGRAKMVGTQTLGKASLEQSFKLKNNYFVKFITGALYDPQGRSWQGIGLRPDYYVEQNIDALGSLNKLPLNQRLQKDVQLSAAWKLLSERNQEN